MYAIEGGYEAQATTDKRLTGIGHFASNGAWKCLLTVAAGAVPLM
jgi:hypothetical protein